MSTSPAASAPAQKVGWLELFFDLVFVAVIGRITHLLDGDPSGASALTAVGLLAVVWTAWFNEVASTNVARGIAPMRRLLVLLSMAGATVMAVGIGDLAHGHVGTLAVGYGLARLALAPIWVQEGRLHGLAALRPYMFVPGVVLGWLVASRTGHPDLLWMVLLGVEVLVTVLTPRRADRDHTYVYDGGHLLERVGLFVMICFGEAVAQLVGALVASPERTVMQWVVAALGLLLVGALFWMFYDVAMDRVEHALDGAPDSVRQFLGFGQIAVVAGILGVAVGIAYGIGHADEHLNDPAVRLLAGGAALVMLGVASLSLEAIRVLIGTHAVADGAGGRASGARGGRGPSDPRMARVAGSMLVAAALVQAVLVPGIVLVAGARVAPWFAVLLLALTPIGLAVQAAAGYRLQQRRVDESVPTDDAVLP